MFVDTNYPTALVDNSGLLWILIVSFIIAFFLAFGVGANDVANSFGTSVGSKVLTLRQACILATIFEILGAILLGYNVSATIRTGMIDINLYDGESKLLMLGFLAALIGSTIWNLVATLAGMPISGTHSIVGAIIGFSIVAKGFASVKWMGLVTIVASWFISPLASGIVSLILYIGIRHFIINKENALDRGLRALPVFYSVTVFINIFSIVHEGPHVLSSINWWMALCIAGAIALTVALVVWFVVVPKLRAKILTLMNVMGGIGLKSFSIEKKIAPPCSDFQTPTDLGTKTGTQLPALSPPTPHQNGVTTIEISKMEHTITKNGDISNGTVSNGNGHTNGSNGTANPAFETGTGNASPVSVRSGRAKSITAYDVEAMDRTMVEEDNLSMRKKSLEESEDDDKPEVAQLFTFLQILTACFGSFAHGGNDVSNAIGPLVAVLLIYQTGLASGDTPWYILLYGGLGISVGLWIWGRRVIETMGKDLTKITPSTGFTIEIGAATTVLLASKIGLPISTTHCKVGSVVMVGQASKSAQGVNWRLFANIAATWILTVPLTALMAAASMWLLKFAV